MTAAPEHRQPLPPTIPPPVPIPEADRAEEALLGAAMQWPECLDATVPPFADGTRVPGLQRVRDLKPEDFHSPTRGTAWRAILAGSTDPLVIEHQLRAGGHLRADLSLMLDWCINCPTRYGAPGWARLVRDAARRRRLLSLLQTMADALAAHVPTDDIAAATRAVLDDL